MVARAFQLITISSSLLEGIAINGSEPSFNSTMSRVVPASESDPLAQLLRQFTEGLDEVQWSGVPFVLTIPAGEISIRRLEFPFKEQKKIDQALVYELENELLEDVSRFHFDHLILPREDGSAEVMIYLVSKDYLQGLLDVCEARNLVPIKVTASPQALLLVHPPGENRHYQIYAGPDEIFVSCVQQGRLRAVKTFSIDPRELNESLGEEKFETIGQMMPYLGREPGESSQEQKLRQHLLERLTVICGEIMRFVHPHSQGDFYTVSLYGAFAGEFRWDEERSTLEIREPGEGGGGSPRGEFLGMLGEFLATPRALVAPNGINFFHRQANWIAHLKEYRNPAIAFAVLMVVLLAMLGTNYITRIVDLNAELGRIDEEIQAVLKVNLKGEISTNMGVKRLEAQLAKVKEESALLERFSGYDYEKMSLLMELTTIFKELPQLSLSALNINSERLSISGVTESYNASESLRSRLSGLKRFEGKEPSVTHQRSAEKITYRITIPL